MEDDHYRELFENAADVVYTHDLEGNMISINRAGERITGYTRGEALEMNIFQMLDAASRERTKEVIRQHLGGGAQPAYEVTIVTKDQCRVAMEIGTRLLFRLGLPFAVLGIARDITERKRGQQLERDRNHVLELVAGNEPLERVLAALCVLLERQCPAGLICSVFLLRGGRLELFERHGERFHVGPTQVAAADRWFQRYGQPAVLFGRMIPVVRAFISLPAGAARMPLLRFSVLSFLGAIPWVVGLVLAGEALGRNWTDARTAFEYVDYVILALIVLAIVYVVVRRRRGRRRRPATDAAG